jgi:hypothetical protein
MHLEVEQRLDAAWWRAVSRVGRPLGGCGGSEQSDAADGREVAACAWALGG